MVAAEQAIRVNGRIIALSVREFRIMAHLAAHPDQVIDVDRLWLQAWGDAPEPRPDLVRACLSRLRRKLETAGVGACLRAMGGHGWIFHKPAPAQDENLLIGPSAPV
jgi:DNA-binding response OmpR family regulator